MEVQSKNINNFTYQYVISLCIAGIKVVMVTQLTIPKLKLSCRIIILTPPWHASPCHTNLCKAIPTQPTEQEGHFVYWKSTSSPGSHPNENRTCRKDLWAAFVLWCVFLFSFVCFIWLFPMWGKENSDKDQQNAHSRWRFSSSSECLMFENDALCSSKIMLTNTGK